MPLIFKVSFGLAELIGAALGCQEMSGFLAVLNLVDVNKCQRFGGIQKKRTDNQINQLIINYFLKNNRCYTL